MTQTDNFSNSKKWGDHFENESINIIEQKFNKVLKSIGKYLKFIEFNESIYINELKGWDTKFGIYSENNQLLKTITFEIKTDKFESNNVFFERTCSKKPSGVFATKADYFVYMMPRHQNDNFFLSKSNDLLSLLNQNKYHLTKGGDGNRVSGFVTYKDDFVDDFKEAGGKVYTCDFNIPNEFNISKFKVMSVDN
jgi:hypothetical protein